MLRELVISGFLALREYIALHVLTCLIPAFLLAGAMISFISREAIISYLGVKAGKIKSFPLATFASFFIAACSCTVIPIASGIYYQGAGIGPAFIFLWVAPATNILSIIYTGSILGGGMVLSRIVAAVVMAFVVGMVMTIVFKREEMGRIQQAGDVKLNVVAKKDLLLLILILLSLLGPNYIVRKGPYLNKIAVWIGFSVVLFTYAFLVKSADDIKRWLKESLWFVRIIFPLLLGGVFIVGVIGKVLPQEVIQRWLGGKGAAASFLATLMGQIMYFATMTEAPFIDTMLKLGMGKGPALALLLTGPGVSLPSMLAIGKVFGIKKAAVYILLIMGLGTFVGWFFGHFIF
ncbi:MAG: permease [Spirochaetota bacterium]